MAKRSTARTQAAPARAPSGADGARGAGGRRDGGGSGQGGGGSNGSGGKRRKRRSGKRSILGRLAYWSAVACLWCVIGLGVLIAYHASKLPPIDQLAVPKRPPNIAILASDGTLLANRGKTGGRTVGLHEMSPYIPMAVVAIEDRRFYAISASIRWASPRAMVSNVTRAAAPAGRLDADPAARQEPVPRPGTHASRKVQEAILALWLERKHRKIRSSKCISTGSISARAPMASRRRRSNISARARATSRSSEAAVLAGLLQGAVEARAHPRPRRPPRRAPPLGASPRWRERRHDRREPDGEDRARQPADPVKTGGPAR